MERERPPDYLPDAVLSRADFTDACSGRDLGAMFTIALKWGGVGFTASHLARRCEMTVSRVQDYVKGRRQAQKAELLERVADGLHIPSHMLHVGRRPWETGSDATPDLPSQSDPLTRHAIELLRRDLTAAIAEGAITGNRVEDWEQTALQYGYATRDHTPNSLIADLAADLAELRRSLLECRSSSVLLRITRVTAQMAGLLMLTFVKVDERTAFRGWARTARLTADETGDAETRSWVRAQEAYGHYYGGNLIEAIEVARHAQEIGEGSPCAGYALAAALEARAYAGLGLDRGREAKSALGRAETVLARLDESAIVPSAFGYNEEQLRFHESSTLTRLNDTQAAWQAQERALEPCPTSDYTDRTLIQLDRAACLIQTHDIPGAIDYAAHALSGITEQQRRGIIALRAREIVDSLPPELHSLPRVREFHDLLEIPPESGDAP